MSDDDSAGSKGFAGRLLLVSAPSGAGKTSLVGRLVAEDEHLRLSVSYTTRPRRASEQDGTDYHFVSAATFERMIAAGDFLEYANVFGNLYGTSRNWVENQLAAGQDVILEIDWQGARQVQAAMPEAVSIFIFPPSRATLLSRLTSRGEDDAETIARRTREAREEMSHYEAFDYVVINDDFDVALAEMRTIVRAERLRTAVQRVRHAALIAELLRGDA